MATSTNVPPIVFTATGPALPTESAILAGVLADENAAFGGGMSMSLSSPQGQLAQSLTAIIGDKNNQIATIVSQIDPNTSTGRWQDAIGQLYYMTRIAASGSVVTGRCLGLVGATIPAGSLAQDTAGYLWASTAVATISPSGFVDVSFQCQTPGPIACAIGTLTVIYKSVTGWESVSNAAGAVLGTLVESRADFEYRRKNSVAANAKGSPASMLGALLAVPNVLDAYVIDNPTGAAVLTGATSYSIAPHSVYIAVVGGASADIALAIWKKKDLGCDYNGNTTATVIDTANTGKPSYTVKWQTPAALPVFFKVSIASNPALPSNIATLVQNAIIAAFNGTDNGTRARIASTLYSGRYYSGVAATDTNVNILSIFIGAAINPTATSLAIGIDQSPTLTAANISVVLV